MSQLQQSTRPLQTVPLDHIHHTLHAKMVPFAGFNMPVQYPTGILQEHLHTREQAGLFDVSHMGAILVQGPHAAIALESLIASDIQEMSPGQVKYGLLLNQQGGIIDDLLISHLEDGFLLVVNADGKENDLSLLNKQIGTKINLIPLFDWAIFALQGPKSACVLKRFFPEINSLTFMSSLAATFEATPVFISRTGYTGEDGFELILEPHIAQKLFQEFLTQPEVKPIGLGARDSLRLEAGLCLYGHDITQNTTPAMAGLTWAIGKRRRLEGCFPGAEIVLAEIKSGPKQKRVGFIPQTKAIAREGCTIHTSDNRIVGTITSGTHSPSLGKPIAMGYLDADQLNATNLMVNIRSQLHPVKVEKLPFVPHNYYRG